LGRHGSPFETGRELLSSEERAQRLSIDFPSEIKPFWADANREAKEMPIAAF
jgi:hypothetical protein